jgi:hypothetical protein
MADTFTPPADVARNAQRALDVRAEKPPSEQGMTAVGLARANQLANRDPVSLDTIQRMVSYFARHEVDKQGLTWDEQGKGWQAWMGWGGDEGRTWANQIMEKNSMSTKASRRHSESDMGIIRKARRMAESIKGYMADLGDDGVDPESTDAMKSYDENGMEMLMTPQASRDSYLEDAYESAADMYGRWSHYEAHYFDANPFASEGIKCSNCVFYRQATDAVGVCEIVEGAVSAEGVCKLWIIPAELRAPEAMTEGIKAAIDRDTTPKQREAMPAGDFVFPDTRNFPIVTPDDVSAAVSSWGRYGGSESFDTFKQKLITLTKRKGQDFVDALPKAWLDEMATKSALDASDTLSIEAVKASLRKALGR